MLLVQKLKKYRSLKCFSFKKWPCIMKEFIFFTIGKFTIFSILYNKIFCFKYNIFSMNSWPNFSFYQVRSRMRCHSIVLEILFSKTRQIQKSWINFFFQIISLIYVFRKIKTLYLFSLHLKTIIAKWFKFICFLTFAFQKLSELLLNCFCYLMPFINKHLCALILALSKQKRKF